MVVNGKNTSDVNTTKVTWRATDYDPEKEDYSKQYILEQFYRNLDRGSFVRYGKADDDTPADGEHSIVFDGLTENGTGIYAYEANQDGNCGVGYRIYTFKQLYENYEYILYYVEHALATTPTYENTTYHKVECNNCDGYLRQTHTGTKSVACYSPSQHKTSFSCCTGSAVGAHTGTKSIAYYNSGYHKTSFGCCSGGVLSAHTGTTCTYSSRYYHTVKTTCCNGSYQATHTGSTAECYNISSHTTTYTCCGGSEYITHTASAKYASYSVSKHKVTFDCCDGYVLQAHTLSNGICTICGFGRTEAASTDNPAPSA